MDVLLFHWNNRVTGWLTSILTEWSRKLLNKK